jgi:uncharacterized protein YndB with AHSA1/START domain
VRGIHRELSYAHPPERVWKALTDPRLMALWLMDVESFEPRVGCAFRFRTKPAPGFDGVVHCEVVEVEPLRRLAYTWASGKQRKRPTLVTWELEPHGPNTRLRLTHDGFTGLGGLFIRTLLGRGWGHKLRDYMPRLLTRMIESGEDVTRIDREGLLECGTTTLK